MTLLVLVQTDVTVVRIEEDEFDAGVPIVPGPVSAPLWVTRNRFAAL